jgi:type II secretory pathway predicted ATPase ExeA
MYETFYGLGGNAFRLTPDRRGTFPHASYTEAAETLLETIKRGDGVALLSSAPGTGKTTLINDLAARLESDGHSVGKVVHSQVDADDLLRLVGFAFGLQADAFSKAALLTQLRNRLGKKSRHRSPAVLIIDEAQNLTAAALEELRLLCNLTTDDGPVVQVLLAGQERLSERLRRPECEPIQQLVVASCRLNPLSATETRDYISQALQLVGWKGDPEISAEALRLLHGHTGGVPRLINLTVGRLLLHGSLIEAHRLDAPDVESVLAQLGNDHPNLLLDTSKSVLLSESAAAQPLLPLDAGTVVETEQQKGRHWRAHLTLSTLARKRDAATQFLKSGFWRVAGWNWKWAVAGLSAAAITTSAISLIDFERDRPVPPAALELVGGQESGIVAAGQVDPPSANGVETPVERATALAPVVKSAEVVAAPADDKRIETQEPDSVQHGSVSVSSDAAPGEPQEAFADIPPDDAEILSESAGATRSSGVHEGGLDQPVRDRNQISDAAMPRSVQEEGQDQSVAEQHEIEALLTKAELAMSTNRLTVPSGDNAYAYYREVLALDPKNAQARAGIGRIVHRYRQLAQQRLRRGDWRGARRFASRGLKIWPRDAKLRSIKRRAARARVANRERNAPETPEVPEPLKRIAEWFRSGDTNGSAFLDP